MNAKKPRDAAHMDFGILGILKHRLPKGKTYDMFGL